MKRIISLLLSLIMVVCLFSACGENKPTEEKETEKYGKIIYVSVDGNDSNDGTESSPLATFGGAVAKVREYKTANGLPDGGIKVEFASGTYKVTEGVVLTAQDSGEEGKPIVYAAAKDAEVIFNGGITVNGKDCQPADEGFKSLLQTEDAKNNVYMFDLVSCGAWETEKTDFSRGLNPFIQTLYVNDIEQRISRWPNNNTQIDMIGNENGFTYFSLPDGKAELWKNNSNIKFNGFDQYDWSTSIVCGFTTDPEKNCLAENGSYGTEKGWIKGYLFDIPEELDSSGEYYWDTENGKVYFWPDSDISSAKISFSQFGGTVVLFDNVSYVKIDGFMFENCRGNVINTTDAGVRNLTVNGCIFRCIGADVVYTKECYDSVFSNNMIYSTSCGGFDIGGGGGDSQTCACNIITNNEIHDYAIDDTVYNPAIRVRGAGMLVSHNLIYNAPHEAMEFTGGNMIIEYNEVHDVCDETADAGAFYTGRRYDWGGNIIRYNYLHDIDDKTYDGNPSGIYLDDDISGQTVYGNILANIGGNAIASCGGKYNNVYNNLCINVGGAAVYNDARGVGWADLEVDYNSRGSNMWSMICDNLPSQLWKYAYSELEIIDEVARFDYNGPDAKDPKWYAVTSIDASGSSSYDRFFNNVAYSIGNDGYPFNSVDDYKVSDGTYSFDSESLYLTSGCVNASAYCYMFGDVHDNINLDDWQLTDICVDPENGNYLLKDDSPVYRLLPGFEKWDYSLIGIQK